MSTTNTTGKWYWYIRKKGRRFYLGIFDNDGDAPATAGLDIDVYYTELSDEVTSDDDDIPIPDEFQHGLAMGVVYEYLRMNNIKAQKDMMRSYKADFENAVYDATHYQIRESAQPLLLRPLDMRLD